MSAPLFETEKTAKPKREKSYSAEDVMAALARRYAPPAWALLAQVSDGTGYNRSRWADAIAFSLWPSRGLDMHGFEVKVGRGDWRRELKDPAKAEEIARFCDYWWIVAPAGIVDLRTDPIPPAWGVLELDGRGLGIRRQAERNAAAVAVDKPMVAAILRRASEHMIPKASIKAEIEAARAEGRERGSNKYAIEAATLEVERVRRSIAEFEKASGVRIQDWGGENCGRLFKLAQTIDAAVSAERIDRIASQVREALATLVQASKEAREVVS